MNYRIPKFYGISDIDFIYHGDWSDPEVRYKNQLFNYYDLEDSLYSIFKEENDSKCTFENWVLKNKEKAFEVLDTLKSNIKVDDNCYDL